jgi:hypothetical protein
MKNLILSTTILFFGQFTAQCVKLYVKAHLSGSPICQLSEGNYIEICEEDNEVYGCPRDFYVYDKGSSYGNFTYELSLDKGWSTHYMTLMVNPTTKRFGFILQGQTALYSYYTEADIERERTIQEERRAQEIERQLENDKKNYTNIDKLIKSNQLALAIVESAKLKFPEKYYNYSVILKEKERIASIQKIEEETKKAQDLLKKQEQAKMIELNLTTLIEKKEFEAAGRFFIENNNAYDLNKYYKPILDGLTTINNKDTLFFSDSVSNVVIQQNKTLFKDLPVGNYEFLFNALGTSTINNQKVDNSKNIQYKVLGVSNLGTLKTGDKYLDGIIINITPEELVICSMRPLGSGGFDYAAKLCSEYKLGGLTCRLPNVKEFESIMNLTDKLDSYEKNWYWTSKTENNLALHVGIVRGDAAYVPKEHGKWIFAVTSIPYFKIPLNSKMQISILETKDQTTKVEYFSSSTKPIYSLDKKSFYHKTKNKLPECAYNYNVSIPKNSIREVRTLETIRTANGNVVFKEIKTQTTDFQINKKD